MAISILENGLQDQVNALNSKITIESETINGLGLSGRVVGTRQSKLLYVYGTPTSTLQAGTEYNYGKISKTALMPYISSARNHPSNSDGDLIYVNIVEGGTIKFVPRSNFSSTGAQIVIAVPFV